MSIENRRNANFCIVIRFTASGDYKSIQNFYNDSSLPLQAKRDIDVLSILSIDVLIHMSLQFFTRSELHPIVESYKPFGKVYL